MTSGAIQHGVPTNVFRSFCPPRSVNSTTVELTPKSKINIRSLFSITISKIFGVSFLDRSNEYTLYQINR